MQVTLKKGIFLLSFICLLGLSNGISLAGSFDIDVDESSKSKCDDKNTTDPQPKTDSTEVVKKRQEMGDYDAGAGFDEFNDNSQITETDDPPVSGGENGTYYGSKEKNEDSSQSLISFNFLYYLLQKFKLTDTLGY